MRTTGVIHNDTPPLNTPIWFWAAEFGCTPRKHAGFAYHPYPRSEDPKLRNEISFFVYPLWLGFPPTNPPFHAPPYAGLWGDMSPWESVFWKGDEREINQYLKNYLKNSSTINFQPLLFQESENE